MNWRELFDYISIKLNAARQAIDVEPEHKAEIIAYETNQAIEQSRAERFLQQMAQAVDVVLREEIIRAPSGRAFVPESFVIFLNLADDREMQGKKRDFVKNELAGIILEEARSRAGDNQLTVEQIKIDLRVDATLEDDEMRATAIFEDQREMTIVADKEKTVVLGEQQFDLSQIRQDKQTVFVEPLYVVEVWEGDQQMATIPVYKRQAVVGRGTTNMPVEIPLNRQGVSRRHAVLEFDDDNQFWLTHCGSNATVVDEVNLEAEKKARISPHQKLEICGLNLEIHSAVKSQNHLR